MAYFQGTIRSTPLGMDTPLNIVIPFDFYAADGSVNRYDKTLILLHSLKQNAQAWSRTSSCKHFANLHGYNLIIPEVPRSFYTEMCYGLNTFTYLTKELPQVAACLFNIPIDSEHLYIGGLSMGGMAPLKQYCSTPMNLRGPCASRQAFSPLKATRIC